MRTNHRVAPALTAPWLIAAAAGLAVLAAAIFLLNSPKSHAAGESGAVVSTTTTKLGRILVNSRGHTLYLFSRDRSGKSTCTGKCASFWPPLISVGKPRAVSGARASLLGTTKRADGRLQVTYNHHPLYTFVKDKQKGQTNGEGISAFGGNWDAVSPAGTKVVKAPPPVSNGIPQHNGGDHDSDNNGGPSDGDGNI